MMSTPDPDHSPRLHRLLGAQSARVPAGLADRLYRASAPMLPENQQAPAVLARLSFRWVAAAAALLLASGLALRFTAMHVPDDSSEANLTAVMAVAGDGVLGEDFSTVNAMQGVGLNDLDAEMQLLLKGRVDG